jgi:hypothetical protein
MRIVAPALLLPLLLAACVSSEEPVVAPLPAPEDVASCKGDDHLDLIGQPATALETRLILGAVRLVRPHSIVTQEYLPQRINFDINSAEVISGIRCG